MKARKGFTLMELLVVVLVMATLAGIMVPRIVDFQKSGKKSNCKANTANLRKAIERYAIDYEGTYPATLATITGDNNYFPHGAPECAFKDANKVPIPYVYTASSGTVADHTDSNHGL